MFKILFGLLGIALFIVIMISAENLQINGDEIDCFDKNNNKMIGQRCIVENGYDSKLMAHITLGMIASLLLFGFMFVGHMADTIFKETRE